MKKRMFEESSLEHRYKSDNDKLVYNVEMGPASG